LSLNKHWRAIAVALILVGPAFANQLPGDLVSGHVTAVAGNSSINIDGKVYHIKAGSPAADAARTIAAGQVVDAQLNGRSNSSGAEVINLVARGTR
jgi:hypothetical protein